MTPQDQAVYFNAVPLLVLAAAYLLVAAMLGPTLWRERGRAGLTDIAVALVFPGIGIPAAIFGIVVLADRSPVGGHVWPPFAACLIGLVPPTLVGLARWHERSDLLLSGARAREAEELVSLRDRELDAVAALASSLARMHEPVAVGRTLLDEIVALLGVDFSALALIGEDGREAHGLVARSGSRDVEWWAEMRIDLVDEPSGIASAYFDASPVAVYDVRVDGDDVVVTLS